MNNWKIHFGWTVALGILLLISVITFWLGGKGNEMVSYVSFASALISIILALVAIFYSMSQNTSSQQNIGEMKTLVEQASALMTEKAETIGKHSDYMARSAQYLTQYIAASKPMKDIPFDFYASTCSHAGLVAIYCLAKSHEAGKTISLLSISQKLAKEGRNNFYDFLYGLGVLMSFVCFLKPGSADVQVEYQKANNLPPGLMKFVLDDINRRIADSSTKPEDKEFLNTAVRKIDAYFSAL